MASLNRVIVMGNLTKDVEVRNLPSGKAVADVGVALNEHRKNQAGEAIQETTFIDATFWGRTAEIAAEFLQKGSPVVIEGRLKQEKWETDGQPRSKLKIVCERMQMVGGKPSEAKASNNDSNGDAKDSKSAAN